MAEFTDVVSQIKRMCTKQNHCYECPMRVITYANGGNKPLSCIAAVCDDEVERLEKIVMDWAANNPEPRYPSWNEAWMQIFPNASNRTVPCLQYFLSNSRVTKLCAGMECNECRDTPIPADIAEKLGVKPIGGDADA